MEINHGGYIRDVIAGAVPNDIDLVVQESKFDDLENDLVMLGYRFESEDDESHITYVHPTLLPLDVILHEDIEEGRDFYLGPSPVPDFDINLLTYGYDHTTDSYNLYNFVDIETIDDIITRCSHANILW